MPHRNRFHAAVVIATLFAAIPLLATTPRVTEVETVADVSKVAAPEAGICPVPDVEPVEAPRLGLVPDEALPLWCPHNDPCPHGSCLDYPDCPVGVCVDGFCQYW